ncbi:hypothetical protein E4U41_001455 [Claviceps citrina]|nr:hypothetical protein E4U41_001455 [Claviceps citrina]
MMQNRREDRRDSGSYDPRRSSGGSSYHNDRRSESERRRDSNRSSNHRDYTDTGSPPPPANATSHGLREIPNSVPFATMHQPAAAISPPWRDSELKAVIEDFCDKMWWRVQFEHERKREKKLHGDRERCPPNNPETAQYSDLLRFEIERCQKARKICSDRMNVAEDKLMAGIAHLMERYATHTHAAPPGPGATNSHVPKEEVEAMSENLRGTVDASVKKRVREETEKFTSSTCSKLAANTAVQTELLKETDELKKRLDLERQRNDKLKESLDLERKRSDKLEKKLENMEQKLNRLSQRQDRLAEEAASTTVQHGKDMGEVSVQMKQAFQRLDSISLNSVTTGELKIALEQMDDVIASPADVPHAGRPETQPAPSGSKTRLCLRQLSRAVEDLKSSLGCDAGSTVPPCIAELQDRVSSCTTSIQAQCKQSSAMSETLRTLEQSTCSLQSARCHKQEQSPPPPPPPLPPPPPSLPLAHHAHAVSPQDLDKQMTQLSKTLMGDIKKHMQEELVGVVTKIGHFIDQERREREQASVKADLSCDKVEALCRGVDELRKYTHDWVHKLDGLCVHTLEQLRHHKDGMVSFDARLQHVAMEHAGHAEEVAMQLRVLNTWQSNFTTRGLYREIVEHITRTLPTGLTSQMAVLSARVDAVEGHLRAGEAALKKRKLHE